MQGQHYLAKLIADRWRAGADRYDAAKRLAVDLPEIRGVGLGLVAAGALQQDDMEHALRDLEATLHRAGVLELRPLNATAATASPIAAEADRGELNAPLLHAVVGLAPRTVDVGHAVATLVSLEHWSTMLVLRVAYPGSSPADRRRLVGLRQRWRGWDDAATQYRQSGASLTDAGGVISESRIFEPGPPSSATVLTVVGDDTAIRFTVPVITPTT